MLEGGVDLLVAAQWLGTSNERSFTAAFVPSPLLLARAVFGGAVSNDWQ